MARLRLLLLVPFLCITQTLVLAQYSAYNYGFDVKTKVRRQLTRRSELAVRGKTGSGGDVVVRQEIRQMEQDADLWTLYILALSMLQFTDQSSPTSYYGLAGSCLVAICASYHNARDSNSVLVVGIHGMPHHTWGGVEPVPGSENTGYCTHSSVLFPTWHRPYMALYEVGRLCILSLTATRGNLGLDVADGPLRSKYCMG